MNPNPYLKPLLGACILSCFSPQVQSATKEDYLRATDSWVRNDMGGRWEKMVNQVLQAPNPPPDGKYILCGRGEVSNALPLALIGVRCLNNGDEVSGKKFLQNALRIVQTCNKVTVDNYDDNALDDGTSRGQINFVLSEVVDACVILKERGFLKGEELQRTRVMLEKNVEYRMTLLPQIGMGGLSNQINHYAHGVLAAVNFLNRELLEDKAFAASRPDLPSKMDKMLAWSALPLKNGLNYPYLYKLLDDGTFSQPYKDDGRDRVTEVTKADPRPHVGNNENSSGYAAESVYYLLRLCNEIPAKFAVELTDEKRRELCDWLMGWSQQLMPIGLIPSYGDAEWEPNGTWIAAFETAAKTFSDPKFGAASAHFKDTADRIFQYGETAAKGKFWDRLFLAVSETDDAIKPVGIAQRSTIVMQQSGSGELQPGKVILRGEATKREEQPFAMFDTFYNKSHSHPDWGALLAYGSFGSIFQHEASYDAGPMYFHNMFIVRPANEPFLPFAKLFKDPKDTLLEKGKSGLESLSRKLVSAEQLDFGRFAWAQIVTNVRWRGSNNGLNLTRQAVLEKKSGILIVADSISGELKEPVTYGPLWHVQNVLDKNESGFLCQDDYQHVLNPKIAPRVIASTVRPVWIGVAGPQGSTLDSLDWHFYGRHYHSDIPQKTFLSGQYTERLNKNQGSLFLTLFVPLAPGTTKLPEAPAKVEVTGATGTAQIGGICYKFGDLPAVSGNKVDLQVSGMDEFGKEYTARLLHDGSLAERQLEIQK